MRNLIERVKGKSDEIKKILPDLIEYHISDEIETKCNEITDLLVEDLWEEFDASYVILVGGNLRDINARDSTIYSCPLRCSK